MKRLKRGDDTIFPLRNHGPAVDAIQKISGRVGYVEIHVNAA